MGVKTTSGAKVEAVKELKVLIALGNKFKNLSLAGVLWTDEKPYEVPQARANELLAVVVDGRRPFVIFTPPPAKVEVSGVEVAPMPSSEPKRAAPPASMGEFAKTAVIKEIGTAEEAAELGLTPAAGAQVPEGEKLVTV